MVPSLRAIGKVIKTLQYTFKNRCRLAETGCPIIIIIIIVKGITIMIIITIIIIIIIEEVVAIIIVKIKIRVVTLPNGQQIKQINKNNSYKRVGNQNLKLIKQKKTTTIK